MNKKKLPLKSPFGGLGVIAPPLGGGGCDLQVTQISPEVHLLPGIGFIEYIYTRQSDMLVIKINGNEAVTIQGTLAKDTYHKLIGIDEETDPLLSKLNALSMAAWGMSLVQLTTKTRKKEVVEPRQILMWHLFNEQNLGYSAIGRLLNGFDSHTVLHAVEKIEAMKETDHFVKKNLNKLKIAIKNYENNN